MKEEEGQAFGTPSHINSQKKSLTEAMEMRMYNCLRNWEWMPTDSPFLGEEYCQPFFRLKKNYKLNHNNWYFKCNFQRAEAKNRALRYNIPLGSARSIGCRILSEDFKNYADVCFREFGDRVKYWITVNEALQFTTRGFGVGKLAPGHCTDGLEIEGIGKLNCPFGDYPFSMRALVRDRLPVFTHEEKKKLKNSYDFIGLNYYTSRFVRNRAVPTNFRPTSYQDDSCVDITVVDNDGYPIDHAEQLHLHDVLSDTHRSEYLALHLHELKEAIRMGVDARGYFTWSLIDNFEWSDGYTSRLGLHFIDYYGSHKLHPDENEEKDPSPPHLCRIPKQSVTWFKKFLQEIS
ncbi:hypothetical protein M5K25_022610 [Dendrobium thyrsiflorum]|uniref:Beta-glucosidase n=1 Tax=Dendrobium thyrsiflorum TaxID=117978 RepID=A0ABD0UCP5_DENTH